MGQKLKILIAFLVAVSAVSTSAAFLIPVSNKKAQSDQPKLLLVASSAKPRFESLPAAVTLGLPTTTTPTPTPAFKILKISPAPPKKPLECRDACGNGICDSLPCKSSSNCPCPEYYKSCPADCP